MNAAGAGRPLGSRYFYVLAYVKNLKGGWGARRLSTAGAFTPLLLAAMQSHRYCYYSNLLMVIVG